MTSEAAADLCARLRDEGRNVPPAAFMPKQILQREMKIVEKRASCIFNA